MFKLTMCFQSEKKDEKPPVTTVFVGNISERAPDAMVRQMLQRCGNVLSWKRVQGASGKLQAFGFCEYESPEATLRCIRLLNEWSIADKKLVVSMFSIGHASHAWLSPRERREIAISGDNHIIGASACSLERA